MPIKMLPAEYAVEKPYARGLVAGGFVFLSGVGGIDPATDTVVPGMAAQAEIVCKRIKASLELAGSSVDNIVKVVTYVTDMESYRKEGAAIVRNSFPKRASTLIGVRELAHEGMMIEVDVTALLNP